MVNKNWVQGTIENYINDLIFYFSEYSNDRKEYAEAFKKEFCDLVDRLINEFENESEE